MPPRLKPLKDENELAAVPLDEPVLVELEPAATGVETEPEPRVERTEPKDGAQSLEEQLRASESARIAADERAREADQRAQEATADAERLKSANVDNEKELLTTSLASAQAEETAAKGDFEKAFEAGDAKAMADAQSKIGRAAARVLQFEGAVASHDEDARIEKERPRTEPQVDIVTSIDRDPKLMPKEREWLKQHTESLTDTRINQELAVGYNRAIAAGHKRGSDGYFQYLDNFMGYAKPAADDVDDDTDTSSERASIVAAPVSRDSRSVSGRPNAPTRITLSPGERELARSMGLTDVEYARGKVQLEANKRADPEKYARR